MEKGLLAFGKWNQNGIKIGSPMQAGQVSDKHSLIEKLIWIQLIGSCKNDHSDWKIYCPRKLSNGKVMMETTPHPVGSEFVVMFGWLTKTINVRNLNFQKGRFLKFFFMDGLDHRNFQKQCDRSKPSGKLAELPQFRSL